MYVFYWGVGGVIFFFFPSQGFLQREAQAGPAAAPGEPPQPISSGRDPRPDPAPGFAADRRGSPAAGGGGKARTGLPSPAVSAERGLVPPGGNTPFPATPLAPQPAASL